MRSAPFKIQLRASSGNGGKVFGFRSAAGVESPETVRPEEVLLLQGMDIKNIDAILNIDSRIGVPGCVLGDKASAGRTMMTESDARASLLSELNRRRNDISSAEVMITSDLEKDCIRKFDRVAYAVKESDPLHLVKQKISSATKVLRDEGSIHVSSSKGRAEPLAEFLETFGNVSRKIRNDCTLLELEEIQQKRKKDILREKKIEHSVKGEKCRFKTLGGTFRAEELNMIEMMSRELDVGSEDKVLDLEAGFGGSGIFSSKLYGCEIVFTDRNAYMTDFIEENCEINDISGYSVMAEDGAENFDLAEFDAVLYSLRGDEDVEVVKEDIHEARRVLREGGKLYIAHRKSSKVERMIKSVFGDAQAIRREIDFQVTAAEK
jgi:16S rRNA G1207 methylase RsmC